MDRTSTARERVLKAACKLISRKVCSGASTRELAQQAKGAKATLFRQFANNESLSTELLCFFHQYALSAEPEHHKITGQKPGTHRSEVSQHNFWMLSIYEGLREIKADHVTEYAEIV